MNLPEELRTLFATARQGAPQQAWHTLFKAGDWLLFGVLLAASIAAYPLLWKGGVADRAIVRRDGQVVIELALDAPRQVSVAGALGPTVIEITPGRARILADPGPRQICVQQGWLTHANAIAICAPSHITLQLAGKQGNYDSLNY
ncbi:MAG: hypothetical protein CVU17_03055 [Betaproteobacteria bacterium HGW-Betaproteobacteria-11]|nr:MAG: hypothetical protein CVU17_03055 [Betaproteobacteria bacterium HGW-Betaproteobacteria-11]